MIRNHVSTRLVVLTLVGTILVGALAIGMQWMQPNVIAPPRSAVPSAPAPSPSNGAAGLVYLEEALADVRSQNLRLGTRSDEIVDILVKLEARLGELEARPGFEASPTGRSDVAQVVVGGADDFDPDAERRQREQFEKSIESQFDLLGENLGSEEQADVEWSAMAQRDIEHAVAGMADRGLALDRADCGSTYCRIELDLDPALPDVEVFRAVREFEPWSGEVLRRVGAGEDAAATIYLAREGHGLPHFELADQEG
jgi:plasmid stabilization system protein ParE